MDTQKIVAEITEDVKETMGEEGTGQGRHKFLETYLDRFFQEWEGKI